MYCEEIATFRDVLLFVQGVCTGLRPPHGSDVLPGFTDFLAARYGTTAFSWPQILHTQFGEHSWQEACAATCDLLHEWQAG